MMTTPDNLWDYNASTYQTYTLSSFAVVVIDGIVLMAYVWIATLKGLRGLDANAPIDWGSTQTYMDIHRSIGTDARSQ